MAKVLQVRQGNTLENNSFIGKSGELSYDTQAKQLRVHDGVTAGGKIIDDTTRDVTPQVARATITDYGVTRLSDNLVIGGSDRALTAQQGKVLNDQAFGIGQTWQDVTASRVANTSYLNSSNKPIQIAIQSTSAGDFEVSTDGSTWVWAGYVGATSDSECVFPVVPPSHRYRLTSAFQKWSELK